MLLLPPLDPVCMAFLALEFYFEILFSFKSAFNHLQTKRRLEEFVCIQNICISVVYQHVGIGSISRKYYVAISPRAIKPKSYLSLVSVLPSMLIQHAPFARHSFLECCLLSESAPLSLCDLISPFGNHKNPLSMASPCLHTW